jgi:hypothetical protein
MSSFSSASKVATMSPNSRDVTFHPFLGLPKELQIKIWKYTIPRPQVIQIEVLAPVEGIRHYMRLSTTTNPLGLQACKLFGELILEEYNVCIEEKASGRKI